MKPIPKPMHFAAGFLCLVLAVGCTNYPKEVRKALERGYGHDFPSYTFRGSPVGNFGVGTIYAGQLLDEKRQPQEDWLMAHPNSWYADSVTDPEKKELDSKIFEKGTMGSSTLEEKISSRLKLSAAIPNIAEILNANATVEYKKGVKVTLKAFEAINRQMNWSEFENAVHKGKMKPYVRELVDSYSIVVVSHDIILKGYSAEIQVDQSVNQELNAKLNEAIGKTVGIDSKLGVGITKKSEGVFEVTAVNPVVAAVLFKHPPRLKSLPSEGKPKIVRHPPPDSLDQWEKVVIPNKILDPVEKFFSDKGLPKTKK